MYNKHMFQRLFKLIFISAGIGLLFPIKVFASSCSGAETSIINCDAGGDGGIFYILSLILDVMAIGVGILGIAGISWAGIQYLTAGDNLSRATKAKRRLYEITIGVACYAIFYSVIGWLMPSGVFHGDSSGVESISISFNNKAYVGNSIAPTITFNEGASDKTFSLKSNDTSIARTYGSKVKCVEVGSTAIEAITSNGKKASASINCEENPNEGPGGGSSSANTGTGSAETIGSMLNTKLNGNPNIRKETKAIINDHRTDFYYNNFHSKISKFGGYKKYLKKTLGGVFAKYANKKIKVKTAADFQEAAEYVWGLWTIWGTDYDNNRVHHSWRKGNSWNGGKSDGFYTGLAGRGNIHGYGTGSINTILSKSTNIRTNCNTAVNTFRSTTNLKKIGGATALSHHLSMSKVGKITKVNKLRVGDIVHFFHGDGTWYHVALVGEVYKDYVVLYDGGSRFIESGNYKKLTKRTNGRSMTDSYRGSNWWAARPWNINQDITLGGIN